VLLSGVGVFLAVVAPAAVGPGSTSRVQAQQVGDVVSLENGRCRLDLDAHTGEIIALQPGPPSLSGSWFEVVEEDREGLAPWEAWKHGAETVFAGGPATVSCGVRGGTATAVIVWRRPNGLRIRGDVELGPGDAGPRFRLQVRNETGAALVDTIRLPVLRGVDLGDAEDDWFTWPHTLGARFRVRGFEPGERIEQPYPEFLYMQWLDLHDATQGVYVGCLDDYGYCKNLFMGRESDGRSTMGVSFTGCWIARKPGTAPDFGRSDPAAARRSGEIGGCPLFSQWTTPWVQIAAHEGDWRAGADLYRPFAEAAFGPLDPPERVREMPTAQCWLGHHASDGDVGRLFEIQQQAPIHASYLMKSLNTSIPEGWDGFRGSALELHDAFDRIRELGGSPALFTFDRAPLMGRPNYASYVGQWTLVRRDGSFAQGFRDMMPSPFDPDLVRARVGEAVRWVREFGIDEIHFDTAATTGPSLAGPSYRFDLPQRPNEVPHYFKALYRAIRDGCREYNPDFLLRAEHCADFFFPEFLTSTAHFFETGNLVAKHNPPKDAELLPILFRYTLPRHAALEMPSMSDRDFWTYGYGMGYGFHGGGPSWSFNPGVRDAESPPGELLSRYCFYDPEWRRYYDFRVGFEEAVIDADRSDCVAQAEIDGQWRPCTFPGPLIAVTHSGAGREVTLGQWFHQSHTVYFGERFVGPERMEPRPVRLRVPSRLKSLLRVRLLGETGELPVRPSVRDGWVEVEIPDPTCFALEVYTGPSITLSVPELAQPGQAAEVGVTVVQDRPVAGSVTLHLPAGWPPVQPLRVPARAEFSTTVRVEVPAGVFGRNYPLKAVLQIGDLSRTTATHLRVMEPVTVLYGFDSLGEQGPLNMGCVGPGRRARLTVTCVNNTPEPADLEVRVDGEQVSGQAATRLEGIPAHELGAADGALRRWIEGKAGPPPNAAVHTFDYDCTGVPAGSIDIQVLKDGAVAFRAQAFPRTRLMDLNGTWQVGYTPCSRATVGGAERQDSLDTSMTTPDVWDGSWEARPTPLRFTEQDRKNYQWGIYRRLVYVPAGWQGAEVQLRLSHTGAPWGEGGTLNIVYVNGWPAGRVGTAGECPVSPFLVFGGWNLLAVCSYSPNSLVDPYLFVRDGPAPERLTPAPAGARPEGAFLLLGRQCTGQGLTMPFIQGVPEDGYRRTDVAAGGESVFIYFAVADQFLRDPTGPVEVAVEYLDRGTAPFGLDYDSADETAPIHGAFKSAPTCQRTNTGEWRTHVFVLPDARLANREHIGSDFRLWAGGSEDLLVRRVEVRRAGENRAQPPISAN